VKRKACLTLSLLLLTCLASTSQTSGIRHAAQVPPPTAGPAITSNFFAMDVAGRYCCSTSDPWPWTGISAQTGITFGTYRTLGTGVSWAEISLCPPSDTLSQCTTYLGIAPPSWTCNSAGRCYNWSLLDYYVGLAQTNGQALLITAWGTPAWDSNTTGGCSAASGTCPPADIASGDTSWKHFITDLIAHEGVGKIKYIELWNEPDVHSSFWEGTSSQLVQMVVDGETAAKAADSAVLIISPPVTADVVTSGCSPIDPYLATLLADPQNMAGHVDIIGFHGYVSLLGSYPALYASCINSVISEVQADLSAAGVAGGKPIYDTEASWGTAANSVIDPSENSSSNEEFSYTGIAYLIQAGNTTCSSTPCYPLTGFSWYGWDFEGSTGVFWDPVSGQTCAFPPPSGTASPCLTNAGVAYANLYTWLVGAKAAAPCSFNSTTGVWTCNFTRTSPTGYQAQAVWSQASSCSSGCSYTYPSGVKWKRNLTQVPPATETAVSGGTVTIGYIPILLETAKLP
jgi:hypothetical protein